MKPNGRATKSPDLPRAKKLERPSRTLSVREFRANLASALDFAAHGGSVRIVYGKRGQGKTFLLKEVSTPKPSIFGCMSAKTEQLVPDEELFSADEAWVPRALPES